MIMPERYGVVLFLPSHLVAKISEQIQIGAQKGKILAKEFPGYRRRPDPIHCSHSMGCRYKERSGHEEHQHSHDGSDHTDRRFEISEKNAYCGQPFKSADHAGRALLSKDTICPADQWTVTDKWKNACGLSRRELFKTDPEQYNTNTGADNDKGEIGVLYPACKLLQFHLFDDLTVIVAF
jgi:hypothetical protein